MIWTIYMLTKIYLLEQSFAAVHVNAWPSRLNLVWVLSNSFFWFVVVQVLDDRVTETCTTSSVGAADFRGSGSWRGEVKLEVARREGAMFAWPGHALYVLSSTDIAVGSLGISDHDALKVIWCQCVSIRLACRIHVCWMKPMCYWFVLCQNCLYCFEVGNWCALFCFVVIWPHM
jgi:hypothetical protein